MNVVITKPAKESLLSIYNYFKSKGNEVYANRLRDSVIAKAKSLSMQHLRGQQEELLIPLNQNHRYIIVEKHYKIIYLVGTKNIVVTDIFDTRQNPEKLLVRNE
jgi:plasmid stabilization system protein ParE